jgi:pyrroline-5-carboxylate reductase
MGERIVFIGGGNMATAIMGGMLRHGVSAALLDVVEPVAEARERLAVQLGVQTHAQAGSFLDQASVVVWAVKPQSFRDAAVAVSPHSAGALHLSVAAGIRTDSIALWLSNERVVRSMPNTPALIGKGMTALFARPAVTKNDRAQVEHIIASTGELLWVDDEPQLDAVTALSGSGPAYMFYLMEAMTAAGAEMGLAPSDAYRLAVATFIGAGELAKASPEAPEVLRQRVTSKGGTTCAAITAMDEGGLKDIFSKALHAAHQRAKAMGDEFGAA